MKSAKFNGYDVHLVETVEELQLVRKACSQKVDIGVDTETSGLDHYKDDIAGVCISGGSGYGPGQYHGFYIPVRHSGYQKNLPLTEVVNLTQDLVNTHKSIWFNRDFDNTMLEKEGYKAPCVGHTHDCQCMCHLIKGDPMPSLKDYAHDYLKIDVIHFSENNAEANNFKTTDPTVTYVYAAQDPIITVLLARKIWAEYPHIRKIYPLDNKFAECMRRFMYSTDLYLDHGIVRKKLEENAMELASIKRQIFSYTGYQFRLTANRDIADALSRYVTLTAKTKSGTWDTSKEVLSEMNHPLADMILKYKTLEKFRGTYLAKMDVFPQPFHINYQHCNAATGRLSSGGSKGNTFFAPFNIQNVPKVEIMRSLHYAPHNSSIGWTLDDDPTQAVNGVVNTPTGAVPISDLKEGMQVETSKGFVPVISIESTEEEVITLESNGKTITCYPYSYVSVLRNGERVWVRAADVLETDEL